MTATIGSRIRVTCECGKKYGCGTELAGHSVRCRRCGEEIKVPNPSASPADTEEPTRCPECHSSLLPGVGLCLDCGYDIEDADPADLQRATLRRKNRRNKPTDAGSRQPGDTTPPDNTDPWLVAIWGVTIAVLAIGTSYAIQTMMNGRQFVGFYLVIFVVAWITSEFLRDKYESVMCALIPASTFVVIGAVRIVYGHQHNMHRFGLLYLIMFVGSVLILVGVGSLFSRESPLAMGWKIGVPGAVGAGLSVLAFGVMSIGWSVLVLPMLIGGIVWAIIVSPFEGSSHYHGGGCSSCSGGGTCGGGGGCGGGGCGGGGCGGCGGE